jgi:hypothetical protein
MNTTLSTIHGRHDHPPHLERASETVVRHVGFLDRFALHLGIALIKWGRRPRAVESRERRATRVEQQLARLARERHAERSLRLTVPLR